MLTAFITIIACIWLITIIAKKAIKGGFKVAKCFKKQQFKYKTK